MVIVINSVIGGFRWVDLVRLAASTVQLPVSDCSQLSDYTVQFNSSTLTSTCCQSTVVELGEG